MGHIATFSFAHPDIIGRMISSDFLNVSVAMVPSPTSGGQVHQVWDSEGRRLMFLLGLKDACFQIFIYPYSLPCHLYQIQDGDGFLGLGGHFSKIILAFLHVGDVGKAEEYTSITPAYCLFESGCP